MKLTPRLSFLFLVMLILLSILVVLSIFRLISNTSDSFELSFLDVGQGDAILLETLDWNNQPVQVLIDGGRDRRVLNGLGSSLPWWDRDLDYVIATHPDADHIGGLLSVFKRFKVGVLIDNAEVADTPVYSEYLGLAKIIKHYQPAQNIRLIRLGPETSMTILPTLFDSGERNDNSVIVRIDHRGTSFLLTGDASMAVEEYLIKNYRRLLDVDVLKLGHHGSRTSTSNEFLAATTPDHVVISAPIDSQYGHPHSEVLDNLAQYNLAEVWFTGSDGLIRFFTNYDSGLKVDSEF